MAEISAGEFEFPELPQEQPESAERSPEVRETAESIEKATLKPEEKVEAERDFKSSEELETAFTAVMEAAPAEVAELPEVNLNTTSAYTGMEMQKNDTTVAGDQYQTDVGDSQAAVEGAITIEPAAEDSEGAEAINTVNQDDTSQAMGIIMEDKPGVDEAQGIADQTGAPEIKTSPAAIIDSNDGVALTDDNTEAAEGINTVNQDDTSQAMGIIMEDKPADSAAEGIVLQNMPASGEIPGIDGPQGIADQTGGEIKTTPAAIIDTNDGTSRESIGTWPTPESPAIMEGDEELIQGMTDPEIVSQLMDQLPKSAAGFIDQAAPQIVDIAVADAGADFVSPIRSAIQDQYQDLSATQADGLLAASLLKAADSLGVGDFTELEDINVSELTAENTNHGAQSELNALEAELSAVEQDLGGYSDRLDTLNDVRSALREEIQMLREELDNWPDDGSTREITYSEWIQNEDGSFSEIQHTKTMTKAEVRNLMVGLEAMVDTIGDMSEMDMLKLQDAMNKQAQLMQMMSNIQKMMNDTAMAIIRNLK